MSQASPAPALARRAQQLLLDSLGAALSPDVEGSFAAAPLAGNVSVADVWLTGKQPALPRPPGKLAGLCHDAEGWGPFSQQRDLDLTPCAWDFWLLCIPALLFGLWAALDLSLLARKPARPLSRRSTHVLRAKQVLLLLLVALSLETCISAGVRGPFPSLTFVVALLHSAAYAVLLPLVAHNHTKQRRASTSALLYLLLHILVLAARLRTEFVARQHSPQHVAVSAGVRIAALSLLVAVFGLECAGPSVGGPAQGAYAPVAQEENESEDSTFSNLPDEEGSAGPSKERSEQDKECPENTANIFSRLAFWWMGPMMTLGAQKYLKEDDLWALPPGEDAENLGLRFEHYYATLRTSAGKPRIWTALGAAYGGPYAFAAILKAVQDCLAFAQPQLLRRLLVFVQSYGTEHAQPASHGFALSASIFLVAVVQTSFLHQYFQRCFTTGMRVRAGLVSAIFKKSLRLSNEDRAGKSTGETINIMSVDATRLQDLCTYGHILWSAFFQMTLAFISLYELLGWSSMVGVAIMVISVPLNTVLARYMRKLSTKQMKIRDRRTKFMSEILNNIKSIKLFAWEEAFTAKLHQIRNVEELSMLRWSGIVSALFQFFWTAIPFFVSLATFTTYSLTQKEHLTADIIFPALSLYQLLSFPLAMAAGIISATLQATVSAQRISEFLDSGELDSDARKVELPQQQHEPLIPAIEAKAGEPLVELKGASFSWSTSQQTPTLNDIDLSVGKGELLAVLGKVGDGKSSLLSAILGEMHRCKGDLTVRGRTAYFVQGGWCMGSSIRDNILFGLAWEPDFYKRVVAACALEPDFDVLPDGDATEVGEKGVSLSGGQRARVALARAVYARADIYLLDDPLAAVDAHVGSHIFKHVIGPEGMLKSKARILTTNSVAFLPHVDQIVSFLPRVGKLSHERGTYDEVMDKHGDVFKLINGLGKQSSRSREPSRPSSDNEEEPEDAEKKLDSSRLSKQRSFSSASMRRPKALSKGAVKRQTVRDLRESTKPKEKSEEGAVSWSVYKTYASSASVWGSILYLLSQVLTQVLQVGRDWVLKAWAGAEPGHDKYYLTIYAIMGLSGSLAICVGPLILYAWLVIASARRLHDGLFASIRSTKLQWFENTPTGRILNLFSRDVNTVDEVLPRVISSALRTLMVAVGVVCVVTYSVPPFVLAIIPLAYAYSKVMKYYLATSRELKRLDAVSKSPIFTWFQESLGGLSTIRAFNQEGRFIATSEARVDRNQMAYFPAVSCNRWLAVRIEFMGSSIILVASTLAVYLITSGSGRIDAGLVGLMLSQALSTTQTLNWLVRSVSEVEQNIVSVERILSYSNLEAEQYEAAYTVPAEQQPPKGWPGKGKVEFRGYSTRYRAGLPLVLKDLNLSIAPGEKIGVVGRTGAGKSSLTLALFRIVEAASGGLFIDGVDCSKVGLRDLRRAIAIIPQDPQLWEGSLRDNLDPTGEADEPALWAALTQSGLKDYVNGLDGRLDAALTEGASNMSAGQRQLLCIARALLRGSRILVLDEATSAVDLETDDVIQKVLREIRGTTTITVAHRINTILNADRVLVLANGAVEEFASPKELLADEKSQFRSMALEAGLLDQDDEEPQQQKQG